MAAATRLDGGFVRRKLATQTKPVDAAGIRVFAGSAQKLPALHQMGLHRIYDDTAKPLERIAKIPRAVTSWNSEQLESPLVVKSIQAAILKAPDPMALRFPEASDDPPSAEKNSRLPGECLARDFAD